jgi:hypothetical protein
MKDLDMISNVADEYLKEKYQYHFKKVRNEIRRINVHTR